MGLKERKDDVKYKKLAKRGIAIFLVCVCLLTLLPLETEPVYGAMLYAGQYTDAKDFFENTGQID